MTRSTERLGRSGEYYVCHLLSEISDTVTLLPHGSHADLVFEFKNKLLKCQVKTVSTGTSVISKHTNKRYRGSFKFDLRRSSHSKERKYLEGEVDIFACFVHPLKKVIFIPANTKKRSYRFSKKDLLEINTLKTLKDSAQQMLNQKY